MKKIYDSIKNNKDDLENFETHKKLIYHILPSLKSYNFCIKQFLIRHIILFQVCKLCELLCK